MQPLKLTALDTADLAVISAHMQDAVARVGDFAYVARQGTFALVANRFVWTGDPGMSNTGHRRQAGLSIGRVRRVRSSRIRRRAADAVVSLLAITFIRDEGRVGGTIELTFSGGGAIRLEVECIEAQMSDLGDAWETPHVPRHDLDVPAPE